MPCETGFLFQRLRVIDACIGIRSEEFYRHILSASIAADKDWERERMSVGDLKDALPKLHFHCYLRDKQIGTNRVISVSIQDKLPKSHVLTRHQYGWLSAGAPSWASLNLTTF